MRNSDVKYIKIPGKSIFYFSLFKLIQLVCLVIEC